MSTRPQPKLDEFMSLPVGSLLERYRIGVENFDRRVVQLTDEQLDMAWLPTAGVGRWPCRVLLGHLADAELVFVARMRQMVAEDRPTFSVWDEDAFVDSGIYSGSKRPIGAFIATIHTLRKWHAEWLATLEPAAFDRAALHPLSGAQTTRLVLTYATWHLEHHAWYLNAKIDRLMPPS